MQYPYATLAPDYTAALERMQITRVTAVEATAERLVQFIDAGKYDVGCKATGVPVAWAAASFEREASSDFKLNPAQGWPLTSVSKWIPHNGPFADWTTAQIAAYQIDGLDKIGAANWTWARACYEGEIFNGMGYRAHGIQSPYLFAGTSVYVEGKYNEDGHFVPTLIDQQLGIVPIIVQIIRLRPRLALADQFPESGMVTMIPPTAPIPSPPPAGVHDAAALQTALNKLGDDPQLAVDDSYGRQTAAAVRAFQAQNGLQVDGVAGPATWAAINAKLGTAQGA